MAESSGEVHLITVNFSVTEKLKDTIIIVSLYNFTAFYGGWVGGSLLDSVSRLRANAVFLKHG